MRRAVSLFLALVLILSMMPAALAASPEEVGPGGQTSSSTPQGPEEEPGTEIPDTPDPQPGEEPGTEPGEEPGTENPGEEPGQGPEDQPGTEPGEPGTQPGEPGEEPGPEIPPEPQGPAAGMSLVSEQHVPYLEGAGYGYFKPLASLTRAQIATILYRLLPSKVPVTVSYSDVPAGQWYTDAALQLGSLGVIRPGEATFEPDHIVTRGEFASYVAAFFEMRTDATQFPDVSADDPYYDAILSGRAWGWLKGRGDGTFDSGAQLVRCEAVSLLNSALHREGDWNAIHHNRPAMYLDVGPNDWFYCVVLEATVPHQYTTTATGSEQWTGWNTVETGLPSGFRTEGVHYISGWAYYYDAGNRDIVRDATKNGNYYGRYGRFTTGDAEIDEGLRQIFLSQVNPVKHTQWDMLQRLYAYCRDNFRYLKRTTYPVGSTAFIQPAAKIMLQTHKGNCYCFASVFYYLAKWIGYDAKVYSGTLGTRRGPHSWVEISFSGVPYIFDTQLEWRYVHDYGRSSYYGYFFHFRDTRNAWNYRKS